MFFVLIGILGISAAWIERPADSGKLRLLSQRTVQMPYNKTRAYMLITAIFILATLIEQCSRSCAFSFCQSLGVAAGGGGAIWIRDLHVPGHGEGSEARRHHGACSGDAASDSGGRLIGLVLHVESDLTAGGQIVVERFLRGSPLMAPLLFCNVGLMGLLALLEPGERPRWTREWQLSFGRWKRAIVTLSHNFHIIYTNMQA